MGYTPTDYKTLLPSEEQIRGVLGSQVEQLPSFPVVATKLLALTDAGDTSPRELVKVMETDPALAARVLRLVNSAGYARAGNVTSLSYAVTMLGFTAIRTVALAVSVYEGFLRAGRETTFDLPHFWQHCLAVASLCRAMAKAVRHPEPEAVYVAGLLHDIGKIVLDVHGRVNYQDFLQSLERAGGDAGLSEEETVLGMHHSGVGGFFADRWKLPEAVAQAILLHHHDFSSFSFQKETNQLIAIVALANFITWSQGLGSLPVVRHPHLQPQIEEYLDPGALNFADLLQRMDGEVKAAAHFYKFSFPHTMECRIRLVAANIRLARLNGRQRLREEELRRRVCRLDRIRQSISRLHRSLNLDEIVGSSLEAIRQDFHYDRVAILLADKERQRLVTLGVLEPQQAANSARGRTIPISPDGGGLLDCLRLRQPVIIRGNTPGERQMLAEFGAGEIGLTPVTGANRVLGVLAADNAASGKPLVERDLAMVAIIAGELGIAIENAHLLKTARKRADHDALTGLFNRGKAERLLAQTFREAADGNGVFSIALLDVDHFKRFNDTFGHPAGDTVLKLLASVIRRFSRPTDQLCRYGGEEFLLVFPNATLSEAAQCAERLRREVEALGRLLAGRFPGLPLSVSIGVSAFFPALKLVAALVEQADCALYHAKASGRNRVVVHTDGQMEAVEWRSGTEEGAAAGNQSG